MELKKEVERELATGRYRRASDLVEQAIRDFLEDCERARRRVVAHPADLYEQVLNPEPE
jgi:Arc/MetJ-type ribon-helix-helix transcriptional regulator